MNKKVSLGVTIAIAFVVAAIAFTVAFVVSHNIFNSKINDLNEKQDMFTRLSDVDSFVREYYDGTIDEEELHLALCKAYSHAVGDAVLYLTQEEYTGSKYESEQYNKFPLSDGSYLVIVNGATPDEAR